MYQPLLTSSTEELNEVESIDADDRISSTSSLFPPTNRRKYNSSTDDSVSSTRPKLKSRAKRVKVNNNNNGDDMLLVSPQLVKPTRCQASEDMIKHACRHCYNTSNMSLMEWSEAVLIQLCSLGVAFNFALNDWAGACMFVQNNEWNMEVSYNIKEHIDGRVMLSQILHRNHKIKIQNFNMHPNQIFINVPQIDYDTLKKYKLNADMIKPFNITNFLPIKSKQQQNINK